MTTKIEAWADYARNRFESAAKRVDEFRNWARQLGAAIAVVIGFELTLIGRVIDLKPPANQALRYSSLAIFLLAALIQALLLFALLRTGYVGRKIYGPESPVTLWPYVGQKDFEETVRMIGAYYANAHDHSHALSEELGEAVSRATRRFAASIVLFLAGVLLFVFAAATTGL